MGGTLSPRKLPIQARGIATRDAIIEAAAQILARGGLPIFTTNAVAERAGVSIGSLYQYFPNKDALMMALIARQQAERAARVTSVLVDVQDLPLEQAVRLLIKAAIADDVNDGLLASALDHEEARLPTAGVVAQALEPLSVPLAKALAIFLPGASDEWLAIATQTIPPMVRAIVDLWTSQVPPQLHMAEDEAVRAVLGYLRQP